MDAKLSSSTNRSTGKNSSSARLLVQQLIMFLRKGGPSFRRVYSYSLEGEMSINIGTYLVERFW